MATHPTRLPGGAARFWAGRELTRRWRATILLGLLAGAAGGVSIAAIAGARRTDAAFGRFKAATGSPDAVVFGTQVGAHDVDYSAVQRLPEVLASRQFALASIATKQHPELGTLAPADDHLYRTVARPLLVVGRLPRRVRVDEIVVNRRAAPPGNEHGAVPPRRRARARQRRGRRGGQPDRPGLAGPDPRPRGGATPLIFAAPARHASRIRPGAALRTE